LSVTPLSTLDLTLAALLVLGVAALSLHLQLGLSRQMILAGIRTTLQLLLIGLVLKVLFSHAHLAWVALLALVMLLIASREVMMRQGRRFRGWWGYGLGALSMFISSFSVTLLSLTVIIAHTPWYSPQYAIPLLGMLLGNTMNGVALGLERLTQGVAEQRAVIEARLMLGHDHDLAVGAIRRSAMHTGMMPIINAMTAAGLVSLPGMMTGQILAGAPPMEAVRYQILIMFLIASGTGLGTATAVWLGSRRLFDDRDRLRLDRLR
jgi:putative ABC transport system permease protein